MRTLYIDLASHHGLIACVAENQILSSHPVDHRIDDGELLPRVEDALIRAGWSYLDLTHIACVVGPGGFMSLRVAVALCNTLSHELKIPAAGIHLSDLYESRIMNHESWYWLHSTKKHELFIRESSSAESRCISTDELSPFLQTGGQWTGELIPEHRMIVDAAGMREAELRSLEEILPSFLQSRVYGHATLTPWYGRGW